MQIKLLPWSLDLKDILVTMCNTVDRSYLSDRLPDPYTVSDAVSWLGYIQDSEKNGTGIFRAIEVDGNVAGSISVLAFSQAFGYYDHRMRRRSARYECGLDRTFVCRE